jgi:hypothetical protein
MYRIESTVDGARTCTAPGITISAASTALATSARQRAKIKKEQKMLQEAASLAARFGVNPSTTSVSIHTTAMSRLVDKSIALAARYNIRMPSHTAMATSIRAMS